MNTSLSTILINERQENQQQIQFIQDKYGTFYEKQYEPQRILTQWDFVIQEMVNELNQESKYEKRQAVTKDQKFWGRKYSKQCMIQYKNQEKIRNQKQLDDEKKIIKISHLQAKIVKDEFFGNLNKIINYQTSLIIKRSQNAQHQRKLQGFVTDQIKLGQKVAESFQENLVLTLDQTPLGYMLTQNPKEKLDQISLTMQTFNQNKIKTPFLIKLPLRDYQLIGLNWLATLHSKNINGILADEMGLGKTIQTISLLAYLAAEKGIWGPHLIIVPTSILINWEVELKRWCPAFSILVYFGSQQERKEKRKGWSNINFCNICITSYKIALQDQAAFKRKRWYYLILDEAHQIKNFKSQRAQVLLRFRSKRRLLITGTPLQNDINELWSLMHFLMPNIFDSQQDFEDWFHIPMNQAMQKNLPINKDVIAQLHKILRPFLLRRLKKDVEKSLPSKDEKIIRCPLSRRQKFLYDEFIHRDINKKKFKSNDFLGLMNCLIQLRKVCNHPNLFEPRSTESPIILESIQYIFPTKFFGLLNNMTLQGFNFLCQEYLYSKQDQKLMEQLEPSEEQLQQKLNSIKFGNCSQFYRKWEQLFVSNQKERIKVNFLQNNKRIQFNPVIYGKSLINLLKFPKNEFQIQNIIDIDKLRSLFDEFCFSLNKIASKSPQLVLTKFSHNFYHKKKKMFKMIYDQQKQDPYYFIEIKLKLSLPNRKMIIFDSGKLETMMKLLRQIKDRNQKVVIFTQMSKMLDIFEIALNQYNFVYLRMDGQTKVILLNQVDQRQRVVQRFNQDPKVLCFISSTRSGGIGINLTGANNVIFYDTDWNPAMDKQAQDRCHRIGQTKKVNIYRLISEFTIEENILLKSIQKRKLDECIMDNGQFDTELLKKVNIKDILGNLVPEQINVNYQQYQNVLTQVEDKEDQIQQEQDDSLSNQEKIDDIDFESLPTIYQYGIQLVKNPIFDLQSI